MRWQASVQGQFIGLGCTSQIVPNNEPPLYRLDPQIELGEMSFTTNGYILEIQDGRPSALTHERGSFLIEIDIRF